MKKIFFIALLIPAFAFSQVQKHTIVIHNNSLYLKNITTNDSIQINGAGGSGISQQTLNDTAAAIRSAIQTVTGGSPILITLADNFSSSSTTMANVTGWDFPVTIGKIYRIEVIGDYQSSQATTTGCKFGIALSGGAAGTVRGSARGTITAAAAATELVIPIRTTSGAGSFLQTSGVNAVNTPQAVSMIITFTCSTSGTFHIQFGSEVAASETRLNLGSSLIYQILN